MLLEKTKKTKQHLSLFCNLYRHIYSFMYVYIVTHVSE